MAIIQSSNAAETVVASCCELRFWWSDDRWRHEIVSTNGAGSLPRIVAVELPSDLNHPSRVVSPAYQQIHLDEDRAVGTVRVFLVGQAGPHHFSAALLVEERPHGVVIDVDVADRCLAPVDHLAATYNVEASAGVWSAEQAAHADPVAAGDPAVAERGALVLQCDHPHARLIFEASHPSSHHLDEAGHGAVRVQALAQTRPTDRTHRLRYRWRWVTDPTPPLWDQAT